MNPPFVSGHLLQMDPALRQEIRAEQLNMLQGYTTSMCLIATVFAVLLAFYASFHVDPERVQWWLGLKIASAVPRLALAQAYFLRKAQPSSLWHRWAVGLVLVDGLCWGMAAIFLMPGQDQETITIIGSSLMSVAAVATFTLHANLLANAFYCVPMIMPVAVVLLMRGDAFGVFGALALMVFLAGLLTAARRAQRHIVELLWRRFQMDQIVADKEEALRQAERQNTVKSQFVATMSHELRTPLHGILGLTRMLQGTVSDSGPQQQLGLVQRSGEHLLSIINHILDFSRIDAGHLHIEQSPFDLSALLDDVICLTAVTAQDKGLTLQGRIQLPSPCWVRGDAPKVRQVLLNLVGNAIKFTETGTIEVRARRRGVDGPIAVDIEDSGIGITPEDLEHIFDPYRQADNIAGRAVGGTGLGLTISREISRAMGGDITCRSEVGRGSVFEFTAPLPSVARPDEATRQSLPPVAASSWPSADQASADPVQLQGHVLLVEDNDVNAMIVEAQLHRLGLQVELAQDGREALERLTQDARPRPDLVLMDCQMPRLDGFDATRLLRAHERREGLPRLPVIALTASAMAEDSARCLHAGMDAHLPKPFHDAQLMAVLTTYLHGPSATAPASTPVEA